LQPDNHHRSDWPSGVVDNAKNDEDVVVLPPLKKAEIEQEKPTRYLDVRPAQEGQWPVHHTYEKDGSVTY